MSDKEALSTEPYKGVRDFYPADWSRMERLFDTARTLLRKNGYEEYNASPLERSELYESKGNEEIVNEQTYTFTDRGDRSVTLRPEMTPTLARMVAGKRRELVFPLRWFSIGSRFRYERPQRGRLREFYQIDVDLVGLPEGEADAEIVSISAELLKTLGAKSADFSIRINSRALLTAACKAAGYTDAEGMREFWRLLDKKAKMTGEEFAKLRGDTPDPLALIDRADNEEVRREKEKIERLVALLKERGVANATFDPEVVRGFDYYTGMIFEIFDTDPENARSLFGGGRYDGLVSLFGGEPIPAVGFAVSDVSLMNFLETHGKALTPAPSADVYLGTPSPEDLPAAQVFAEELRAEGARVFVNLSGKALGDQVKEAVRRGIPHFIAFGKDEADSGMVKVKTLAAGSEETVARASAARAVAK